MLRKLLPVAVALFCGLFAIFGMRGAYAAWGHSLSAAGLVSTGDVDARIESLSIEVKDGDDHLGACSKSITDNYNATFSIEQAVPGFTCRVSWEVRNTGSVPWRVGEARYKFDPNSAGIEVVEEESEFPKMCALVKPGEKISGFYIVRITTEAQPSTVINGSFSFDIQNFKSECDH